MIKVHVNGGVCNFNSQINVESEDMQIALIDFKTECPNLKPLELELTEVDAFEECFTKLGDSSIFERCKKHCKHPTCPVPTAILKGVEAACGLALPRNVSIEICKEY